MYKVAQQIPYYVPLAGIFILGFIGFFSFPYDRQFQIGILVAAGVSHVVWGIVYHFIHRDLTFALVLEYVVIATFGIAAVLTAISS